MTDVKEVIGAAVFDDGVQISFRISRVELEKNDNAQLGSLLRHRIEQRNRMTVDEHAFHVTLEDMRKSLENNMVLKRLQDRTDG